VSDVKEVDLSAFVRVHSTGSAVIDVREPSEYAAGHVPGAVLMPMAEVGARIGELDRSAPLYVICASGGRSAAVTDALCSAGYDAWNVIGGTQAWADAGHTLDTELPT
jgi:rhodanese-related sulfurtransferase